MIKRFLLSILIILIIFSVVGAWLLLRPATAFSGDLYELKIPNGTSYESIMDMLYEEKGLKNHVTFTLLAKAREKAPALKPGRYVIEKNDNVLEIYRRLRNGSQTPVRFVFNKMRTKEDFAGLAGSQFQDDSVTYAKILLNNDRLKNFNSDTNTILSHLLPDTYEIYWNTEAEEVIKKLKRESEKFWNKERLAKAESFGLSPEEVIVLASIVEEETNMQDEKGKVASVYYNRIKKGMKLQADPTVKYALRDFAIKRITLNHIAKASSLYNTYRFAGLPPGPICTPSKKTIDAVLAMPETEYLFFCAKADLSGYHAFAKNDEEHFANARAYQRKLDSLGIK
jgi:UPF0755 protein